MTKRSNVNKTQTIENIASWLDKLNSQVNYENVLESVKDGFVTASKKFVGFIQNTFNSSDERGTTATTVAPRHAYIKHLFQFIGDMEAAYSFEILSSVPLVRVIGFSEWASIYWDWLHYASFIVQHGLATGLLDSVSTFPILTHNIELILPCSICVVGFASNKKSSKLENITKYISYGATVHGLFMYHNFVSEKIIPAKPQFSVKSFIRKYSIMPYTLGGDLITENFLRVPLIILNELQFNLLIACAITYTKKQNLTYLEMYNSLIRNEPSLTSLRNELLAHIAEFNWNEFRSKNANAEQINPNLVKLNQSLDDESRKSLIDVAMSLEAAYPRIYPNLETLSTISTIHAK